jgi:hypothetical protein
LAGRFGPKGSREGVNIVTGYFAHTTLRLERKIPYYVVAMLNWNSFKRVECLRPRRRMTAMGGKRSFAGPASISDRQHYQAGTNSRRLIR